jgi:hypothetical protein
MSVLIPCLWAAGALHLLIASANFFAARELDYRGNLARVSAMVRAVFVVQNVYIVLVLVATALLCFLFAPELAGLSPLGRFLSGFLAVFWGLRVVIQLFFYPAEAKRAHPLINAAFLLTTLYLCAVYTAAVLGLGR